MEGKRVTISRREPVIALMSFRYRGRAYKEGMYLDRRRTRMPHSRLIRFIREKRVILAKDLTPEKLAEYGFRYDAKQPRIKLSIIADSEVSQRKNQEPLQDDMPATTPASPAESLLTRTMEHIGGGWYNVLVNGEPITEAPMRKEDAKKCLNE